MEALKELFLFFFICIGYFVVVEFVVVECVRYSVRQVFVELRTAE